MMAILGTILLMRCATSWLLLDEVRMRNGKAWYCALCVYTTEDCTYHGAPCVAATYIYITSCRNRGVTNTPLRNGCLLRLVPAPATSAGEMTC